MYSKPPPTASVAEVSTAHSSLSNRHVFRIGATSIGVACKYTFSLSRPPRRRSIQKTVLWSSDSIRKPNCTCNSCARLEKLKTSSGFDGRFSSSEFKRVNDCCNDMNSSPFSSRKSRRFSKEKRPSPCGSKAKKNIERSLRLLTALEIDTESMWLRCSDASTSRQSSSTRPLLTETPK